MALSAHNGSLKMCFVLINVSPKTPKTLFGVYSGEKSVLILKKGFSKTF